MRLRQLVFEKLRNRCLLTICGLPDANLGDDVHPGWVDASSQLLSVESGPAAVCSHIDRDADSDAFRIVPWSVDLLLEIRSEIPINVTLLNSDEGVLDIWESREAGPNSHLLEAQTIPASDSAEPFFLILQSTKGRRGQYELLVFEPPDLPPAADFDGDGVVGFGDFLILSANFGRTDVGVGEQGDVDSDGDVDFEDFQRLSAAFGDEG